MQNQIHEHNLIERTNKLLEEQKTSWPLLQNNFRNLEAVKTKTFQYEGFSITAQYNPARIISTSAETSKEAIESRPCFLCEKNLPKEQKFLKYNGRFNILCNPYPIFNQHFTIANIAHRPQAIKEYFGELLVLAKIFEGYLSILYNGPMCGASAPDHMHFQAVKKNVMPIENELQNIEHLYTKKYFLLRETEFRFIDDKVRKYVVLKSKNKDSIAMAFSDIYNSLLKISENIHEPMMNIISYFKENEWRVIIFPRSQHRPAQYFTEGDDKFLISPAVVDLGGLLILPREEDFKRITKETITNIFNQVIISDATLTSLINKLNVKE